FCTCAESAALANGTLAHAAELEDDQFPGTIGTVWVWPPILPIAQKFNLSGRDVITAAILGWEVTARLAIAGEPGTVHSGICPASWYGVIGATAGVAKLIELDIEQTVNAMSIAASHSHGLLAQTGTDAHLLEAGITSRAALMSALLAKERATGQPDILERRPGGLFMVIGKGKYDERKVTDGLGKSPFNVHQIQVKKYPCCFSTHRVIDAFIMALEENKIESEDIEKVDVGVNKVDADVCNRPVKTAADSRFSFHHTLAGIMVEGKVDLTTFIEDKLNDPRFVRARDKVNVYVNPDPPQASVGVCHVTVVTKGKKKFHKELAQAIGGTLYPLTTEQMLALYKQYTSGILPETIQDKIAEIVLNLEKQPDVSELMELLTFRKLSGDRTQ
ncbi:MAG: MmgE/PrpD family protein, partial [Candidatus Hodarchaeota archaeon]